MPPIKIGILALQGDFVEHRQMLEQLGVDSVEVRLAANLDGLLGIIIPGGESTTFAKLAVMYDLVDPIRRFAEQHPVWGTCAGMIFMAKEVGADQPTLGLMNIGIQRNAFGRQIDSFTVDLPVTAINNGEIDPFPAVFIRAPKITTVGSGVTVIASLADGTPVAAREGKWLATAFHPELTDDLRFHRYFLKMAVKQAGRQK